MMTILYRLSFKRRIWISFVLFICCFVFITGTASYLIAYSEIKNNAFRLSQDGLNKSAQALDDKFRSIIVSVMTLMISEPFIQMLKDVDADNGANYYQYLSKLQTPFTQMQLNEPTISSILISTPIGPFFPTNHVLNPLYSFKDSDMYRRIAATGTVFWEKEHKDRLFRGGEDVISLVMEPTTQISVKGVYVVVNVSVKALRQQMDKALDLQRGTVLLLSQEEGNNVISPLPRFADLADELAMMDRFDESDAGYFEYAFNHTDYLVNYSKLSVVNGWMLIDLQSKKELLKQIDWIQWATILIMAVSIILATLLSNMLSRLLVRPLNELQKLMGQAGENRLNVRFSSKYNDEVAQVGVQFNHMMDELNTLIHKIREVEQDKRKAEVKALQAQIDPHFLYNSLNTIFWKCLSNEHDDAKEVVVALSRLFELGLNNGLEITTVDKELTHVRQYLSIQKKCYTDLFDYHIAVQHQAIRQCEVLKIILQPLVENSILHGFKDREEGGRIEIIAQQEGDWLHFTVRDNGVGMDVDAVYAAMREETATTKGYALRNVYHRLKLYYGEEASVSLYSEPHMKTEVKLSIPHTLPQGTSQARSLSDEGQ